MNTTGVLNIRIATEKGLQPKDFREAVQVVVEHIDRQDKEHKSSSIAGHFCGEPGYGGVANYQDE